jgi:protease-4
VTSLRAAFDDDKTVGVVLRINSPGGSPVQAGIIHDEIRRLRTLHPNTPLYAVVEEVCASGGYYVAAAADRIYVDKASLVGSIGVLMEGFGFVGAMEKLGIERRLLTAGTNKGFLDSFSPLPEDQRRHAQQMLDEIHKQFIDVVRTGRGSRLKESPDLFSGLVWTGAHSVEMGLADGMGTVDSVARDVIKAEDVVDFSTRKNLAERLARRLGATAAETMARVLGIAVQTPMLR